MHVTVKFLKVGMSAALISALYACGGGSDAGQGTPSAATPTTPAAPAAHSAANPCSACRACNPNATCSARYTCNPCAGYGAKA